MKTCKCRWAEYEGSLQLGLESVRPSKRKEAEKKKFGYSTLEPIHGPPFARKPTGFADLEGDHGSLAAYPSQRGLALNNRI